jgi:1D-myo-inositol 3-kinase
VERAPSTGAGWARGATRRPGEARYDYTTVGHVTADVLADGSSRAGGGAFYSALQAARLGLRTLVITRGVEREIEELLAPYQGELEVEVEPAPETTRLTLPAHGEERRRQSVLAWAGPVQTPSVETSILHLAPVAQETAGGWSGRADFVGLTPQGLVRAWTARNPRMRPARLRASQLPERCDAVVFSESERVSCAPLLHGKTPALPNAVVAITAQAGATELRLPGGAIRHIAVPAPAEVVDDIGAGDVFAAAFFSALRAGSAPEQAARFASGAAAVRIAGAGAGAVGEGAAVQARIGEWGRSGQE